MNKTPAGCPPWYPAGAVRIWGPGAISLHAPAGAAPQRSHAPAKTCRFVRGASRPLARRTVAISCPATGRDSLEECKKGHFPVRAMALLVLHSWGLRAPAGSVAIAGMEENPRTGARWYQVSMAELSVIMLIISVAIALVVPASQYTHCHDNPPPAKHPPHAPSPPLVVRPQDNNGPRHAGRWTVGVGELFPQLDSGAASNSSPSARRIG